MAKTMSDEIAATMWVAKIREAMVVLDNIEMDEGIRKTIWRCLKTEFIEAVDRHYDFLFHENDGKRWSDEDDATIKEFLGNKPVPESWKAPNTTHYVEERLLSVGLASKLCRSEKNVKKRASALGFRHFL